MSVPDSRAARVEVTYSNIGEEWIAFLLDDKTMKEIVVARGSTRAEALRNLADGIEV